MSGKTCFVIQRFDNGVYDRRFRETFGPAIERGGARPVRADEVLGTKPVVEKIEQGLRSADVAFAEISEDNPNVFLELGYALSLGVPTIIVCDRSQRESLPFDIAHRPVNFYSTSVQSDYERIAGQIEKGIAAALLEEKTITPVGESQSNSVIDIDDVKAACLTALLDQSLRSPVGSALWEIQKEVSGQNISARMVALAIASLFESGFVDQHVLEDGQSEWISFSLSTKGQSHLLSRYNEMMQHERNLVNQKAGAWSTSINKEDDLDDDIPF